MTNHYPFDAFNDIFLFFLYVRVKCIELNEILYNVQSTYTCKCSEMRKFIIYLPYCFVHLVIENHKRIFNLKRIKQNKVKKMPDGERMFKMCFVLSVICFNILPL